MRKAELELDLGTVTMSCTRDEVAKTLAALLGEMRAVVPMLRPDERDTLRKIMSQESGTLTVADVFPDFARESEAHKTLRRFRAAQFIRPAATGRWDPEGYIEVKPFAQLMWDRVGEAVIFSDAPAAVAEPEAGDENEVLPDEDAMVVEEPAAQERVVLEEPAAEEQVILDEEPAVEEEPAAINDAEIEKRAAAIWEDDDVLDLQDFADEEVRGKR
jgi:hypothetical protein